MKRLLSVLACACALAAACGENSRPAATVGGVEITQDSVVDELEAIAGNEEYLAAIEGGGTTVKGEGDDDFNAAFVAQVVTRQIQYQLVANEVDKRGLEVAKECRDAARDDLLSQIGNGDPEAGEEVFGAFPEAYQEQVIEWNADVLALQGDLAEIGCVVADAAEDYFEEHRDEFERVCVAHILVADEAKANELLAQLQGGADFAALATANSTDTGSAQQGGELPCGSASGYVPEFAEAATNATIGEVTGPVQTQFGFHLLKVSERGVPEFEEVATDVEQQLGQEVNAKFSEWFQAALEDSDVDVDARYGEWDGTQGQVVPDEVETPSSDTSTPDPSAVPDDGTGGTGDGTETDTGG